MKLRRLLEVMDEHAIGIDEWTVLFVAYKQDSAGAWNQIGPVEPIPAMQVIGDDITMMPTMDP